MELQARNAVIAGLLIAAFLFGMLLGVYTTTKIVSDVGIRLLQEKAITIDEDIVNQLLFRYKNHIGTYVCPICKKCPT